MPLFELECTDCGHKFDRLMKERGEIEHEQCEKCASGRLQFCFTWARCGDIQNSPTVPRRKGV